MESTATTPPSPQRPTITCCMMVKNEERRLPTALGSVKDWVDEIIVVDTGSTDRTVEIAQGFGAKIFHHPWENDFSKHRNQSISYAGGDWILILDADEELDRKTAPLMRQLVASVGPEIHALMFNLYNDVSAGGETFVLHPRLFRNHVGFHYEGKVHNRPTITGKAARTEVKLKHYGYNEDPTVMEAKCQRRVSMIRAWVEEEPDNFLARSYLAHALLAQPSQAAEAVEQAQIALQLLEQTPGQDSRFPHAYYPLLNGLTTLERDDEVLRHAHDCLRRTPVYPDSLFFLVWVYFKRQAWEEVCAHARRFVELQTECSRNPQDFIFFENMTFGQQHLVLLRWAMAAARLGRLEEVWEPYDLLIAQNAAHRVAREVAVEVMRVDTDLALALAAKAAQAQPDWGWPERLARQAQSRGQGQEAGDLAAQAREHLAGGRREEGLAALEEAARLAPLDGALALELAQALDQAGRVDQAGPWYLRGLNLSPEQPAAWRRLADMAWERNDLASAEACYRRGLLLAPGDEESKRRLAQCQERLAGSYVTVAQRPPRLAVFLVGGMTPELVREPAPRMLQGRAWGELLPPADPAADAPNWASLYTGVAPAQHGLTAEPGHGGPASYTGLAVPALWELIPPELTLGLMTAPLTFPAPPVNGWAVSGRPAGVLGPEAVHPVQLAPRVLAEGVLSDYLLSDEQSGPALSGLERDVRREAQLLHIERTKLTAAMMLPAVEVLVIGLTGLDYVQQVHGLATYHTFAAYQQVYGWLEMALAALRPRSFAILSQHGYAAGQPQASRGGFYCLSWLRGSNGRAPMADVARELVTHLGGDPARLGQPREAGRA